MILSLVNVTSVEGKICPEKKVFIEKRAINSKLERNGLIHLVKREIYLGERAGITRKSRVEVGPLPLGNVSFLPRLSTRRSFDVFWSLDADTRTGRNLFKDTNEEPEANSVAEKLGGTSENIERT